MTLPKRDNPAPHPVYRATPLRTTIDDDLGFSFVKRIVSGAQR
jgi:hypothetical protein